MVLSNRVAGLKITRRASLTTKVLSATVRTNHKSPIQCHQPVPKVLEDVHLLFPFLGRTHPSRFAYADIGGGLHAQKKVTSRLH